MTVADQAQTAVQPLHGQRPQWRLELSAVLCTLSLLVVAFLVLYPLFLLLMHSFQVGVFGQATTWGVANWVAAFTEPGLSAAVGNTLSLALTRQALALVIGVPIAWLVARTDLPGRRWLEFGFWVAVFLPSITVMVGWILLFDGYKGLVNKWLELLPFVGKRPLDIFSWWGIIFVHLMGTTLGIKIMFLAPAFRNMDASFEEASRASGASWLTTMCRVTVPLLLPATLVAALLGLIASLEAFEIEFVLGAPANIEVFSTQIYRLARENPPRYGSATALSMLILLIMVPLIAGQQWLVHRGNFATVTGKYSTRRYALGAWKWPAFTVVALLVTTMTLLPMTLVIMGSFMKFFGNFEVANPWTERHWVTVLGTTGFRASLINTLLLAGSTAFLAMAAFAVLAYISVRTRFWGRGTLDFLTWIPSLLPGMVISLGFLWMFLETPFFRPMYGTISVLVIAVALSGMTRSVQLVKANLIQLGTELEEASWSSGAAWSYTFRRVILPLIAPTLVVVGILAFSSASRTASHVALLATSATRPLALLQLDFLGDGMFESASVVGVVVLVLTIGAALLARVFDRDWSGYGR